MKNPFVLKKVSINLPFGIGGTEWETDPTERRAAWFLYVELVTRISVEPLKSNKGLLREALNSLYSLFDTTRDILKEAGPDVGASLKSVGGIAIADYNQALSIKPDFATAYNNRGNAKSNLGDKQGAIADYNQAISLQPDYANAYNNRGIVKSNLGDKQGAIADYNQALSIKPDYATAYYNRGLAKSDLGDKQGAIADYNQALSLQPDFATAYNNRGNAKSNLGDKQGAIADYNQAISLQPDYANAYNNRGIVKSNLGDKQGAIADYQTAAQLYSQQGKMDDYKDALNRVKRLEKGFWGSLFS